jgi:hypothetical protein
MEETNVKIKGMLHTKLISMTELCKKSHLSFCSIKIRTLICFSPFFIEQHILMKCACF